MNNSDNLVIEVALVLVTVSVYGTEQSPTPVSENMTDMTDMTRYDNDQQCY